MKIKKICKQCGKEFEVYPHRKKSAKYCSFKCYNPKKRIRKICLVCEKEFETWPSYKKRKYCSRKCHTKAQIKRKKLLCGNCGKEIFRVPSEIRKVNFCNKKCYGEYKKIIYMSFCKNCGKDFRVRLDRIKRGVKYCSLKCNYLDNKDLILENSQKSRFKKGRKTWNKGLSNETSELMQIISNKKLGQKRIKETRELMSKISKEHWANDKYLFSIFRGQIFGKGYKPNKLDKKVIKTNILIHKIRRSLNVNK